MFDVLIAEDEDIERQALARLIEKYYPDEVRIVGEAGSGSDAVDLARKLCPHIILMDIQMPGVNGLDASFRIREFLPDSEIVIVTAYSTFEYARQAIRAGVCDYLIKPYSVASLRDMLDPVLKKVADAHHEQLERERMKERLRFLSDQVRKALKSSREDAEGTSRNLIEEVKAYILRNYQDDITLDDLSHLVGLSKYHLSRMFSEATGAGIKKFIIQTRVEKAKKLLASGMTVSEAAYCCGFKDPAYFSKILKKHTGISPGKLRKRK